MEKAIIDPKKIVRPVGDVLKIRAGWEQLTTAQLLWVQSMAEAADVIVQVRIESDDPRIEYASGQRMPSLLRQFMRRMRLRVLHIAKHTCDVCGATTKAEGNSPVRCRDHIDSEEKSMEINVVDFANRKFPLHDLADMAVANPELAMLGDYILASDLLTFTPELISAAIALYESSYWHEAWIEHIENAVYRATYMASESSDSEFISRKDVAEVVASSNVVERLLNSQTLTAAVRVWARHGFKDHQLKSMAGNAIASVASYQAFQAIEKMQIQQRR